MRMLIVWLAFLFPTYGVHSLVQYSNESKINSHKSDDHSISLKPLSIFKTTETTKVLEDNRAKLPSRIPRDLNVTNETLSDLGSLVLLYKTTDKPEVVDHHDTFTQRKNDTLVTSANSQNVTIDDSEKFSNNTPTTHETTTAITTTTNGENSTHYVHSNKLENVTDVKTNLAQLINDTSANDKLVENSTVSSKSMTWDTRHVDPSVPSAQGLPISEKNSMIHTEDIKNALYIKSITFTNDDGNLENLMCTKMSTLPDDVRRPIIRKMDRLMKKTLARLNMNRIANGNDNQEEENDEDEYDDDDDYGDDDDDDDDYGCGCGCGCGCRRRSCCGCGKCKRKKCPSCPKVVTPTPESGRRSGATFPINFESSETTVDTTTPIETTELLTTTPSTTTTSTTPSTTTTSTTPSTTTTSTTTTTTTTTTPPPPTTTTPTQSTTISTTATTPLTTTHATTTSTTTEILTTKKRNMKRKKCTKKKRRKEGLLLSQRINGNLTMDNDNVMNVTEPTHVPFSGLLETQPE